MSWNKNKLTDLLQIDYPIIQAPMAGGITTAELVSETSNCGGLGNVGAGYMSPDEMRIEFEKIKSKTNKPYGVNLFIPADQVQIHKEKVQMMDEIFSSYKEELQIQESPPIVDKDFKKLFYEQVEVVINAKVPVCSFTFGIPDEAIIRELKQQGCVLIGTATNVKEAIELEESGMDAIVAQGLEAGGHRGSFYREESGLVGLMALLPQIVDHVRVPVIAAGGIMDSRGVAASFVLGAKAAQLGTAFLCCHESGAHSIYKKTILDSTEDETRLTKAFSGKLARGIDNQFIREMKKHEESILPFPLQNDLTGSLRKQAGVLNNREFMSLWAGQGIRLAKETSVRSLMKELVEDLQRIIY